MNKNQALIDGLRDFAAFLECSPCLPEIVPPEFNIFTYDKSQFRDVVKLVGGKMDKRGLEGFFILRREFGAVALEVNIQRSLICERVKTGTRIVPAEPAKVIPPTEEREEEVFEWKCGEVLP